jgi:hypothetical protein
LRADSEQAGLWPILERGLRKTPEDRFSCGEELRDALVRWLDSAKTARGDEATTRARPRRHLQWHAITASLSDLARDDHPRRRSGERLVRHHPTQPREARAPAA